MVFHTFGFWLSEYGKQAVAGRLKKVFSCIVHPVAAEEPLNVR